MLSFLAVRLYALLLPCLQAFSIARSLDFGCLLSCFPSWEHSCKFFAGFVVSVLTSIIVFRLLACFFSRKRSSHLLVFFLSFVARELAVPCLLSYLFICLSSCFLLVCILSFGVPNFSCNSFASPPPLLARLLVRACLLRYCGSFNLLASSRPFLCA